MSATPSTDTAVRLSISSTLGLAADIRGPEDGLPVILSHGGGQTRHAWRGALNRLAEAGFRACSLDLRGHGGSDWSPDGDYSLDAYLADLRAVIREVGGRPLLVGASLGGLTSLLAAGEKPLSHACGVVLVDVSPHLRPEGVETIINFMRGTRDGFDSFEAAADAIAAYLPHRERPRDLSGLRKNLRPHRDGRLYWHWDPRTVDRLIPKDEINSRLQAAALTMDIPVMLLRGEFSELVTGDVAEAFMALFRNGSVVEVPGARHMVAGDENDLFVHELLNFARAIRDGENVRSGEPV